MSFVCPGRDCTLCPRLVEFRMQNRAKFPTYYNGPVPPFGPIDAEVLIAGLAPGLNGANQTARPFTNDYAGDVLYPILKKFGLAKGDYQKRKDDGFELLNVRVTNRRRSSYLRAVFDGRSCRHEASEADSGAWQYCARGNSFCSGV